MVSSVQVVMVLLVALNQIWVVGSDTQLVSGTCGEVDSDDDNAGLVIITPTYYIRQFLCILTMLLFSMETLSCPLAIGKHSCAMSQAE